MKIARKLSALLVVSIFASAMFAQEAQPVSVTIPRGTDIPARLANQLDSGQVHVGDMVTMDVLEDLKLQNEIVIPKGSLVVGHVTEAKGARKMGRGGKLDIEFETVTAGDGTKIPVSGERVEKGQGGYGGGSAVAAGAAGLFFPPAAALLLLKHGHASVIPVGTVLTVHVTADAQVVGTPVKEIPVAAPVEAHPAPAMIVVSSPSETAQTESLGDYARRVKAEKASQPPQ
jgi:hypothetical protein